MGTPVIINEGLARLSKLAMDDSSHAAVGTNSTPPVNGDAQLLEETNRAAVTTRIQQDNVFQIRTLFSNSDLPATTEEFGLFMNGGGSPNTGEMLVRVLEEFTKGSADLIIVFEVTIEEG